MILALTSFNVKEDHPVTEDLSSEWKMIYMYIYVYLFITGIHMCIYVCVCNHVCIYVCICLNAY